MRFDYYPFRLLANEYGIDSSILFQFMPDWIMKSYDYNIPVESENNLINEMVDLICDFSVDVVQKGEKYTLKIMYSDKYSNDIVKRFVEAYKLILSQIINVKELSEINYCSDNDIELRDSINETEHPLSYDDILDAFNDNLAKYPNNKVVVYNDNDYTYTEGAYIADKIAKQLIDLGVEAQDYVGFLIPRSELYLFSILGIMSIGGVYVPLDDKLPDERVEFILNDTDSKVVIVSDETYGRVNNLVDDDVILLNISTIVDGAVGSLSSLPIVSR